MLSPKPSDDGPRFRAQGYGIANLNYEFLSGTRGPECGRLQCDLGRLSLWGELGLGATLFWNDSLSLYGEAHTQLRFWTQKAVTASPDISGRGWRGDEVAPSGFTSFVGAPAAGEAIRWSGVTTARVTDRAFFKRGGPYDRIGKSRSADFIDFSENVGAGFLSASAFTIICRHLRDVRRCQGASRSCPGENRSADRHRPRPALN